MTLPSFVCIGAQKSGTTWIHEALSQNPAVYLPTQRKEVHFFDRYFDKNIEWYEAFFRDSAGRLCGEVTPAYLFDPEVPPRIRAVCPETKLLVSLRDPVRRAYSHYRQLVAKSGERRSFINVINQVPEVFRRGLYHEQLSRYTALFPREQLHILFFEEIVSNPQAVYHDICSFLEISAALERETLPPPANESSMYAQHVTARVVNLGAAYLRRLRLDTVIDLARPALASLVTKRRKPSAVTGLSAEEIAELRNMYSADVRALDADFGLGAGIVWGFDASNNGQSS